jgi:hypothetical protein
MGNWNFEELENSLVSDAEKRITRAYQQPTPDDRGQVPGSNNLAGTEPARDLSPVSPVSPASQSSIIGLKGPDTKGVQTYLPLKDYMRLMQQKTLRKQNIAQIAGEAIIDWLDRQEQKPTK